MEQRRQAMLQLHLSEQQFHCLLRCGLYKRFDGSYQNKYAMTMTTITVMIIPMTMVMKMTTQTVMIMVVAMPTIKILITKKHNDKDENDHDENYHVAEETLDYNEDKAYEAGMIICSIFMYMSDTIIFKYGPPSLIRLVMESVIELSHHQTLISTILPRVLRVYIGWCSSVCSVMSV